MESNESVSLYKKATGNDKGIVITLKQNRSEALYKTRIDSEGDQYMVAYKNYTYFGKYNKNAKIRKSFMEK